MCVLSAPKSIDRLEQTKYGVELVSDKPKSSSVPSAGFLVKISFARLSARLSTTMPEELQKETALLAGKSLREGSIVGWNVIRLTKRVYAEPKIIVSSAVKSFKSGLLFQNIVLLNVE